VSEPVLVARGLSKRFGPTFAVNDLSLTVGRGEIFGFLGPNGAGKTTSIKMFLGLVAPSGGEGRLLGAPIGDRPTRAKVGFLPEHFRFQDWMTARELLRFHGRLAGLRAGPALETRIDALLERVALEAAADRPVGGYSKGMLQRVGLAQALLAEPELVFLDEPTSGLDPLGRRLVREIIVEARSRGTTVFLNSHLLGEVEATCDRVAFVKRGRVVEERALGAAGLVAHEVEVRVGDDAAGTARETLARFGAVRAAGDGALAVTADEATIPEIARVLVERGLPVYGLRPRRSTLEEQFLEVMGEDERPG
jgi:ABC-2 type transport system ATP-binding protein